MGTRHWLPVIMGLAAALPAVAIAQAPRNMGILQETLLIGEQPDGPWIGSVEDDLYVLENRTEPNAIHYAYAEGAVLPERLTLTIEVRIETEPDTDAGLVTGAGLIYAVEPNPLTYYALVLSPDGTLHVLQREPDGLREIDSVTVDPFEPDAIHKLRLIEYTDGFAVFVDNDAGVDVNSSAVGTGTVGIAAFGKGRFAFRDFAVEEIRGLYVSALNNGRGNDVQN